VTASFTLHTEIAAPPERVFDLSLDTGLHLRSMAGYGEELGAGPRDRLLVLGDEVTWRARHYGVPFRMTSRIVELERPGRFVDEQVRGPFAAFRHEHQFSAYADGTRMTDIVTLRAPLGPLGRIAELAFLARRLRSLIELRNRHLVGEAPPA
jgi:ligand-binding SRPBCC domain-containing protein